MLFSLYKFTKNKYYIFFPEHLIIYELDSRTVNTFKSSGNYMYHLVFVSTNLRLVFISLVLFSA
jgi:hypothetical protein